MQHASGTGTHLPPLLYHTMAGSTAKVCGHMGAVLSESDSSSDESSQDNIEVEFREELRDSPCSSIVIDNSVQPPAVEMNGNNVRCALGTKPSASVADGTMMERQAVDNAFGIAYKPCGVSLKQGYELPAGPAFVDEDEFEQEMGTEFRVVLGSSGGSSQIPIMSSGTAQRENISNTIGVDIDDFFHDEGNDGRPKEQKASGRGRSSTPTLKDTRAWMLTDVLF